MKRNVGGRDRQARLVIGVLLLLVSMATLYIDPLVNPEQNGVLAVITLAFGIFLIFTAETRRCPVNRGLGRDTHEH